ncbi:MAG: hypothetical protein KAQ64_04560 [Candidatus Pacebacteria bacterium]|nr:hypothetical protein [Candidatus Paceibacterota bacterium]
MEMEEETTANNFAECSGTPTTPLFVTTKETLENMSHISDLGRILKEAGIDLSSGHFFCIEPKEEMETKPHEQLWSQLIFEDGNGIGTDIRRPDLKVCRGTLLWNVNGYNQFVLEEEPGSKELGVGSLLIETSSDTMIKVWRRGIKGRTAHWAFKGGSLTRGEPVPKAARFIGFIYSNFQRITGRTILEAPIPVYEVRREYPLEVDNSRFEKKYYKDSDRPDGFEKVVGISDLFKGDDGRTLATAGKVFSASSFDLCKTINDMAEIAGVPFDCIAEQIQLNDEQRGELEISRKQLES